MPALHAYGYKIRTMRYQGLAQHYGFHTNMIDVTSNFDVASFLPLANGLLKKDATFLSLQEQSLV